MSSKYAILCHPENFQLLKDACKAAKPSPQELQVLTCIGMGMAIMTDANLPIFASRLVSHDRFVEYGDQDAAWAIYFGLAHLVEDQTRREFVMIDKAKLMRLALRK